MLVQCPYAREVWHTCFDTLQVNVGIPDGQETLEEWWLKTRRGFHGKVKRGFDSLVIGALWAIWKQRNAHVFNRPEQVVGPRELAMAILGDIRDWSSARFGVGGLDRFVRS